MMQVSLDIRDLHDNARPPPLRTAWLKRGRGTLGRALRHSGAMRAGGCGSAIAESLAILTSRTVIAIDQHPLGAQGLPVRRKGNIAFRSSKLEGCVAVAMVNRDDAPALETLNAADTGPETVTGVRDLSAQGAVLPCVDG